MGTQWECKGIEIYGELTRELHNKTQIQPLRTNRIEVPVSFESKRCFIKHQACLTVA